MGGDHTRELITVFMLLACLYTNTPLAEELTIPAEVLMTAPAEIEYQAQAIRTNGYMDGARYPGILWIGSAAELEDYYQANRGRYDLETVEHPLSDQTRGFADAMAAYDDTFFAEHGLILVVLEEGSGSIRHEVTGVTLLPPETEGGKPVIQPEIRRIVPEIGTCDMAEWHILIEVGQEYGPENCGLRAPSFGQKGPGQARLPETESK